jgi:uncharacterized protein
MVPARWSALVWGAISSIAIFALTLLFLKRENRALSDVGLKAQAASGGRFIAGAVIGLCTYSLIIACTWAIAGPMRVTRTPAPDATVIVLMLGSYLALAVMEELGFRGYPLRTLVRALGPWRAQGVVAAAFCLSHVAFGWPWQAVALGVLPSAILFGVAALAARDLAMAIGLHAAINVARWSVGQTGTPGLWTIAIDGAAAALAPAIGFIVTVAIAGALWLWHLRYGSAARPSVT